jgi:hypothetical protein
MSNKNLFKEAIADAKAVREAALVNAKAALEEALTPRLQSMLAAKLNEMEYEEEGYMKEDEEMEEGFTTSHGDDSDENLDFNLEEDFDLSEILAELNEAKKEEEESEEESEEEMPEDIDSLKALIQDLISQEIGKEDGAEMHDEPDADNMGGPSDHDADNADEEIDLEELLAELDEMGNDDNSQTNEVLTSSSAILDMGQWVIENYPGIAKLLGTSAMQVGNNLIPLITLGGAAVTGALGTAISKIRNYAKSKKIDIPSKSMNEKNYEMNEVLTSQSAILDMGQWVIENYPGVAKMLGNGAMEVGNALIPFITAAGAGITGLLGTAISKAKAYMKSKSSSSDKGEMKEAISTINTLRSELNEVNLLNAKLLYVNKIFKAKNLSESQKLKVIASFDKATTVKEAKVVFESLNSTLTTSAPKQSIKESLGFASRAAGVAPRKAIVESNDVIARMQKLANIIK